MTDDADFEALVPSSKVKAAGGAAAITGFWMLLFANQTLNILRFEGVFAVIIVLKFVLAASFAVFAFQIFKLRLWGVYGTVAVGGLTALLTAVNQHFQRFCGSSQRGCRGAIPVSARTNVRLKATPSRKNGNVKAFSPSP
jgi:hypothetical protein